MRILRANDYRRMRWKNGGGETTEIIVSPDGASLDSFDWRVSMAHVASQGPFSLFAGIDRTLAVLVGNGIRLRVDGMGEVALTTATAPFAFAADVNSGADLINGPIHDLNVMSRRGVMQHKLERISVNAPLRIKALAEATLLLVQGGGAIVTTAATQKAVFDGDSILLPPDHEGVLVTPATLLTLYKAEFRRVHT